MKNKCAPPFRQAEFDILYNVGISHESIIIDIGVEEEIIEKSGAWYSYGDLRLGQGKENTRDFLKDNLEVLNELEVRVREVLKRDDESEVSEPLEEVTEEVAANVQG